MANIIEEISSFMLNDVKAFQYLKSECNQKYNEGASKYGIGGGNFLQTLGTLSVFYFLVKMHHMTFYEELDFLKIAGAGNNFYNYSMKIEKRAAAASFKKLCELAKVNWDIKYKDLYQNYRNYLSHVTIPNGILNADCVFLSGSSYKQADYLLRRSKSKTFELDNNKIVSINVDLLHRDVNEMKKKLCEAIQKEKNRNKEIAIVLKIIENIEK